MENNLYTILEVDPNASADVIKKAYKVLAARYHPDSDPRNGPEKIKKINLAYDILSDPVKREAYDMTYMQKSVASHKQGGFFDFLWAVSSAFFLLWLIKLIIWRLPLLGIIFIPLSILYLFVKYPKTFARLYVKITNSHKPGL